MMKQRVVIVDDSLTVRMDLGEAFRAAGYDTVLCASAGEARAQLAASPADLVLLDVVLPDANGVDLLAELRAGPGGEHLRVLLLSTEAEVRDRIRGLRQGADEYVGKPYDRSYVLARAAELMRGTPEAGDLATILVVDDSRTFREALGESLREAGYRTLLAADGEDGLRRAAEQRPDAMVVDGVMPGMDGPVVVRRIRLDPGLQATPCLLLTASESAAGEIVALDAGADAYVRKGEGTAVILARLAAMLRTAEQTRDRAHRDSLMGPKRILAVDDSVTYLEALAEQLRDEGYEVVKARSGEEALELLAIETVDCVLLDLQMPGLSGTETCQRIKSSPALRNLPLIMLTALEDPESIIRGMNAGADDYVAKSVDSEVIKARLRAQLRRKQFEDENRRVRDEILRREAETRAAQERAEAHAELLRELEAKHRELETLNEELRSFAYSVSHDLRQPLRSMDGFSKVLLQTYSEQLDAQGRHYLKRVREGARRMGDMIDGLLVLSRATRKELEPVPLRLDQLAWNVIDRLHDHEPERQVEVEIHESMATVGDRQLVESVLENLLGNAWKFSRDCTPARIVVGSRTDGNAQVFFVRDNGVGFAAASAEKMFVPFQRLHSADEFPGTGIGLATTQRIVHRHGGSIWAEGRPGTGATFHFTLAKRREAPP